MTAGRTRFVMAVVAAVTTLDCGPSPITPARVEAAVERTFANLIELQISRLGMRPMSAPDFEVTAICRRQVAGSDAGSGDWACTIVWQSPERRTLRDTYDLFVSTDGCYTASASGESLGGPILKTTDGTAVRNLLYVFEGCFDTT